MVLSSVYPCALHGAETFVVPRTVLQNIRSKVSKALFGVCKGSSPWLSCFLGSYRCVDPQFVLLMNRVQLFRQLVSELPAQANFFLDQLQWTGKYRGPSSRLVQVLSSHGWEHHPPAIFVDAFGRAFHLLLTPLRHLQCLLLSTWSQEVSRRVAHRKYLTALETIDWKLSRCYSHLSPSDRKLLRQQHTGAFFTGEFLKHASGGVVCCRFCGQPDTRLHRMLQCPRVQGWLSHFPLLRSNQDVLPDHTWAHGLWEEPPLWRAWQAHLDSLQLPEPTRHDVAEAAILYSDGSCLRPRCAHAALSAAAVIQAAADGAYTVVWSGPLPSACQTPYRAELLAGAVAFSSFNRLHLFSDCKAFVRVATRLLLAAQAGRCPSLPREHRDLWGLFWLGLAGAVASDYSITWVPAHRDYRKLSGMERVHAWFNHCVDQVANQSARLSSTPLHRDLVAQVQLLTQAATQLATYQAGVGRIFANQHEDVQPSLARFSGTLRPEGPIFSVLWRPALICQVPFTPLLVVTFCNGYLASNGYRLPVILRKISCGQILRG